MNVFLDKIINLLKWPVAIYMFLSLPALFSSFKAFKLININNTALLCGLVFFIFSKTMMDPSIRTSMQTIAHELTHTVFALLTL